MFTPTAQSDPWKGKNTKMVENHFVKTFIKMHSGFGESNVESAIASFFMHFYNLMEGKIKTNCFFKKWIEYVSGPKVGWIGFNNVTWWSVGLLDLAWQIGLSKKISTIPILNKN